MPKSDDVWSVACSDVRRCQAAGIPVAQLHGDGARAGLEQLQQSGLQLIYVMHATPDGRLVTPLPPANSVDWLLVDGLQVRYARISLVTTIAMHKCGGGTRCIAARFQEHI